MTGLALLHTRGRKRPSKRSTFSQERGHGATLSPASCRNSRRRRPSIWSKKGGCSTIITYLHDAQTGIRKGRPMNITGRYRAIRACDMPVKFFSSLGQVEILIPMSPPGTITIDPWNVTHRSGSLISGCRFSFGFSWRGSGELFRGRQTVEILPAPLTINVGRQRPRVPSCPEKQQKKLSALSNQLEP